MIDAIQPAPVENADPEAADPPSSPNRQATLATEEGNAPRGAHQAFNVLPTIPSLLSSERRNWQALDGHLDYELNTRGTSAEEEGSGASSAKEP